MHAPAFQLKTTTIDGASVDILNLPSPDRLTPDMLTMLRYWLACRGDRLMPLKRDLDPSGMVSLLPSLTIVDVLEQEPWFVYRLVGTRQVQMRGCDPTGKPVGTHHMGMGNATMRERVLANYRTVCQFRRPLFSDRVVMGARHGDKTTVLSSPVRTLCSLQVPFSNDGTKVDYVLGYSHIVAA